MEGRTASLNGRTSPLQRSRVVLQRVRRAKRVTSRRSSARLRNSHEVFMRAALALARRAQGRTSPNPMVGAVIVTGGRIIGRGYHHRAGAPHAEVNALRQAGARARGATLYTTLEPCNHYGRTPPCCGAIITAGITRVVVATADPNPVTNGAGIARLRRAGLDVTAGVLEPEARQLIAPFRKAMTAGLPLVIAKIAQSLDGKIATARGESQWITSDVARRVGHRWRGRVDAIMVGINTVLHDDPRLTARGRHARPGLSVRVVVDSQLQIPLSARCLPRRSGPRTIIATTVRTGSKVTALRRRGVAVYRFPPRRGRVPLRSLCRLLARRGLHSVLIEGGGELLAGALEERLVDRVMWFIAPKIIGGRHAPSSVGGEGVRRLKDVMRLDDTTVRWIGSDVLVEGRVVYPKGKG